jgi:hypothetical protein
MKLVATLASLMLLATLVIASDLSSGPKVGSQMTPFHPVNILNADDGKCNGKEHCLVCQYGNKPVAMVFARGACDCPATLSLIKNLDAMVAKVGKDKISAAVVYLSDDASTSSKVAEIAKSQNIKNVSLAQMNTKGPEGYQLADKAGVTVVLYKGRKVIANHAFEKLCEKCVESVVADLPKLSK